MLTWHNQENIQWSPDHLFHERVESEHETRPKLSIHSDASSGMYIPCSGGPRIFEKGNFPVCDLSVHRGAC